MSFVNIPIDFCNGLDWLKRKDQRIHDVLQESEYVELSSNKITLNMRGRICFGNTKNGKHLVRFSSSDREFDDLIMGITLLCNFTLRNRKGASLNSIFDQADSLTLFLNDNAQFVYDKQGTILSVVEVCDGHEDVWHDGLVSMEFSQILERTVVDGKRETKQYNVSTRPVAVIRLQTCEEDCDKSSVARKLLMRRFGGAE